MIMGKIRIGIYPNIRSVDRCRILQLNEQKIIDIIVIATFSPGWMSHEVSRLYKLVMLMVDIVRADAYWRHIPSFSGFTVTCRQHDIGCNQTATAVIINL
jgi:hypothetical protein